jgi:hypothetical protein
MNDTVIKVEGIGKKYRIRHQRTILDVYYARLGNRARNEIRICFSTVVRALATTSPFDVVTALFAA